jgi:hypothetical protein
METRQLINLVRAFNPGSEHITLATIFFSMDVKTPFHVLNLGKPGAGKSRSSIELLEKIKAGTFIIRDNNMTDRGFFETIKDYPGQNVVMDECSAFLKHPRGQDNVKLGTEHKPISWTKNNSNEQALFESNFLINTNVDINDSVSDRFYLNKTIFNKDGAKAFTRHQFRLLTDENYKKNCEKEEKELILYVQKTIKKSSLPLLTTEELQHIEGLIIENIELSDDSDYSKRLPLKTIEYYKRAKLFFGKLDKEVYGLIDPIVESYIQKASTPSLLDDLMEEDYIDKVVLRKKIEKSCGYTEQHARRIIKQWMDEGKLKPFGQYVKR